MEKNPLSETNSRSGWQESIYHIWALRANCHMYQGPSLITFSKTKESNSHPPFTHNVHFNTALPHEPRPSKWTISFTFSCLLQKRTYKK
jgi:hypothetical protein